MPHNQAASIVAMRNVIEEMTIKAANDPEIIVTQPEEYGRLCSTIRSLCRSNAGRYTAVPAASPTNSANRGYVSFLCMEFPSSISIHLIDQTSNHFVSWR